MPGIIPHLIAGTTLYFIARYTFPAYFKGKQKTTERILLLFICLLFSIIPDAFLGFYCTTNLLPFDMLLTYHNITHLIITPIAILFSFAYPFGFKTKTNLVRWYLCNTVTHHYGSIHLRTWDLLLEKAKDIFRVYRFLPQSVFGYVDPRVFQFL